VLSSVDRCSRAVGKGRKFNFTFHQAEKPHEREGGHGVRSEMKAVEKEPL
jgi:hypothetical protein